MNRGERKPSLLKIAQKWDRLGQLELPFGADGDENSHRNLEGEDGIEAEDVKVKVTPLQSRQPLSYPREARRIAPDHNTAQELIADDAETQLAKNVGRTVPPEVAARPEKD